MDTKDLASYAKPLSKEECERISAEKTAELRNLIVWCLSKVNDSSPKGIRIMYYDLYNCNEQDWGSPAVASVVVELFEAFVGKVEHRIEGAKCD
jgi:hypothetical protein